MTERVKIAVLRSIIRTLQKRKRLRMRMEQQKTWLNEMRDQLADLPSDQALADMHGLRVSQIRSLRRRHA